MNFTKGTVVIIAEYLCQRNYGVEGGPGWNEDMHERQGQVAVILGIWKKQTNSEATFYAVKCMEKIPGAVERWWIRKEDLKVAPPMMQFKYGRNVRRMDWEV